MESYFGHRSNRTLLFTNGKLKITVIFGWIRSILQCKDNFSLKKCIAKEIIHNLQEFSYILNFFQEALEINENQTIGFGLTKTLTAHLSTAYPTTELHSLITMTQLGNLSRNEKWRVILEITAD